MTRPWLLLDCVFLCAVLAWTSVSGLPADDTGPNRDVGVGVGRWHQELASVNDPLETLRLQLSSWGYQLQEHQVAATTMLIIPAHMNQASYQITPNSSEPEAFRTNFLDYLYSGTTVFVTLVDPARPNPWPLSVWLYLLEKARESLPPEQEVLFVLGVVGDREGLLDALSLVENLKALVLLDLESASSRLQIDFAGGRKQTPRYLVQAIQTSAGEAGVAVQKRALDNLFIRLGLLERSSDLDFLLDAGFPAVAFRSTLDAEDPDSGPEPAIQTASLDLLLLIPEKLQEEASSDSQYLYFPILDSSLLVGERPLLVLSLLCFSASSLILLARSLKIVPSTRVPDTYTTSLSGQSKVTLRLTKLLQRKHGNFRPLLEGVLVASLVYLVLLGARFVANSLADLALLVFGSTEPGIGGVRVLIRLALYGAGFFLIYGLMEGFGLIPKVRRSHALHASALFFLLNGVVLASISMPHALYFLLAALLVLTAGNFRPLSAPALLLTLMPAIVFGVELIRSYRSTILELFANPDWFSAIFISLAVTPFILWIDSLFSSRERFQRGSKSVLLFAVICAGALLADLVMVVSGAYHVLPH